MYDRNQPLAVQLPAEVWRLMAGFEQDPDEEDRASDFDRGFFSIAELSILIRVCKFFSDAFLPILYRKLDFRQVGSACLLESLRNNHSLRELPRAVLWDFATDACDAEQHNLHWEKGEQQQSSRVRPPCFF